MEKVIPIDYLRVSVTDRCNLNCAYCLPLEKGAFLPQSEVLSFEEIVTLVRAFAEAGTRKVRLTGGEPLVRKDIVELVRMIKAIPHLEDVALTTNGFYLKDKAKGLKEAGLDRINISLDTLRPDRFKNLAGKEGFEKVWEGIESAIEHQLNPIKINTVIMRGYNDDEIVEFVKLTLKYPVHVRFIEFFPTNERSKKMTGLILPGEEIKNRVWEAFGHLEPTSMKKGNGPANYYKVPDSPYTVGFIESYTTDFCASCNRLRIDSLGRVSPCLYSGGIWDLRPFLREKNDPEGMLALIRSMMRLKPEFKNKLINPENIEMSSIGG